MLRYLALLTALAALPGARADDAIAPETLEGVKKATVFIRVEGDGWVASGSGFVVAGDDKSLLVATNHHVADPTPPSPKAGAKAPKTTVVFDSGTKTERTYAATLAASDPERDLAVLRVAGVKDPPKPIAYTDPQKPVETMQVYTFGFPFGRALATNEGFPAVTVGKASVSSLRNGTDGELSFIQIDGNLNPGNSGGPVVDAKGRLVGVAVATIRDGQGIGLTVPAAELGRTMQGRVGRVKVTSEKKTDGPVTVRIEAPLIDPTGSITAAAARYFVVAPKAKRPEGVSLDGLAGSSTLDLKVEKGVAAGEFTVPTAEGEVLVQVTAGPAGRSVGSRVRAFPLALPTDFTGPPPAGWKEYSPRDKTFVVWLPEKPARQADGERNMLVSGQRIRVNAVAGRTADRLEYEATSILLPVAFAKVARKDLYDLFRGAVVADLKGRVTESKEASSGRLSGAEYVIESGKITARVRMYVSGARVYMVQVTGSADRVREHDAETLLSSYRLPGGAAVAKGPGEAPVPKGTTPAPVPNGTTPAPVPLGKEPAIIAGGRAPAFKDAAPDGGLLIGLELGLGKFGREDVIKAVRPIYRAGGKEQPGTQRGTELARLVTLKAKEGYAVGAMTHKSGLNFDGCSLTFMKVTADGKLDPKDAYESDWVGYVGTKRPGKLGGDGTPVIGIVGRAGDRDLNGLGLLFKGLEGFDPGRPPAAVAGKDKIIGVEKEPFILGSIANDPKFKTVGPTGAILVGVEVRFGKFGATPIARAVRPIYRVNGKEEFGEQFGKDLTGSVTLQAKEGYAVGGVTGRAGWWCNGFSLTFMKVKPDGTLDPKDSYESEWVGSTGNEEVHRVMSDGPPVVGIVGKIVGTETTAFGLLFKGQEDFDPKKK